MSDETGTSSSHVSEKTSSSGDARDTDSETEAVGVSIPERSMIARPYYQAGILCRISYNSFIGRRFPSTNCIATL